MITTRFSAKRQPQQDEAYAVFVYPYHSGCRAFAQPVSEMRVYHVDIPYWNDEFYSLPVIRVANGDTIRLCESPQSVFANSPHPYLFFDDDPLHLAVVLKFDGPSHVKNFTKNPAFFKDWSRHGVFPVLLPPTEGSEPPRQARARPKTDGRWQVQLDSGEEWQPVEAVVPPPPPEEEEEVISMENGE